MSATYPKREPYFAHRFTRLLFKACAAQDIGHHACLLLVHIAHTEDAAHYTGPIRFWNSQLMDTMGFTSPKQLARARETAMERGWLHYDRQHDRSVGQYWVAIPKQFLGVTDSMIEPIHSEFAHEKGMEAGTQAGKQASSIPQEERDEEREVTKECPRNGSGNVPESGKPSIPVPVPTPVPIIAAALPPPLTLSANEPDKPKAKAAKFAPPTQAEVGAYAVEIGMLPADAAKFWDYQMAKGWKVGREPMKDWRAALRYWKGNGFNAPAAGGGTPAYLQLPTPEERAASRAREPIVYTPEELDNQAFIKKMTDEHEARQAAKAAAKAKQEPKP